MGNAVLRVTTVLLTAALLQGTAAGVAVPTAVQVERASEFYSRYSLARLMELEGLYSSALLQYQRAESIEPGHCETRTAVARVLLAMHRFDDAREAADEAAERCPDDLNITALRARIELSAGEPAVAETLLVPLMESGDAPREVAILLTAALIDQHRFEEAEALLAEQTLVDSLAPDLAFEHARTLLLLDRVDDAVAELRRAQRLDPMNRAVAGLLSRLLIATGESEEGVVLLERFFGEAPTEAEYITLARGHADIGNTRRALEILAEAVEARGESEGILTTRAAVLLAAGDSTAALGVYEGLIDRNPESVTALNYVAYTLAEWGERLDTALDYALRAAELAPRDPRVIDTLGWVYYKLGRYEDAGRELERAVAAGASDPIIFRHLAEALSRLGDDEGARRALERADQLEDEGGDR